MDEYLGHLREFRRILHNLGGEAKPPVNRETISSLSHKLEQDESQLTAEQLETSIRSSIESTETIQDLTRYEEGLMSVLRDITLKKRRELERARFRKVLDQSGESILVVDPYSGRILDVNETATQTLGYGRDELLEMSLGSIEVGVELTSTESWQQWVDGFRSEREAKYVEGAHRRKDGSWFPVESSVGFTTVDNEELLLVVTRDTTERKRSESRVRRQWAFFSSVALKSVDGILAFDRSLAVTYWNPAMERILGIPRAEVIGRSILDAVPQFKVLGEERYLRDALSGMTCTSRDRYCANVETERQVYFEGHYSPIHDASGDVAGGVGIIRDITDHRETQARQARKAREARNRIEQERVAQIKMQQRLHSEISKLKEENERLATNGHHGDASEAAANGSRFGNVEGLDVLAKGVASAVEPLMASILSQTGVALSELDEESPLRKGFEEIEEAALDTSALATTLSSFSGNGRVEGDVHLDALVDELAHSARAAAGRDVNVERMSGEEELPAVNGDERLIRDLLMVLVTNAAEAMEDDEDGAVRVATGTTEADESQLAAAYLGNDLNPGRYVYLEVEDAGRGMDETTRAKSFVPFFSTKKGHRGLGLAKALGVVRAHGGAIALVSAPNEGTSVRVLFPTA